MPDIPNVAILTPVRDTTTPEYDHALRRNSPNAVVLQVKGAPVDDARNALARQVLELSPRPEYVVWADDDAYWLPGTIERIIGSLLADRLALISPWHGKRNPEAGPNGYRKTARPDVLEQLPRPEAPLGSGPANVACDYVGSHFMVHRTALLDVLGADPFTVTDRHPGGEDFAFCTRVRDVGGRIAMDCTMPVWHVGTALVEGVRTSVGFVPHTRPSRIIEGLPKPILSDVQFAADPRAYGENVNRKLIAWGVPAA